uniref:Uncharacterized protein n=1 Tax=Timema cristinae TaxID=61476 RepID=A0A7R9DAF0_TIMCR|nr:unnamed protein product [Timema cristinae]
MLWYTEGQDEEEEDLMFSPALMARRASESWINTPPIEWSDGPRTWRPVTQLAHSSCASLGGFKSVPAPIPVQRKKSLPDVQGLPKATDPMSREEVSVLSSARREEIRKMADEAERLRANPLLYLVSPHVKVRLAAHGASVGNTMTLMTLKLRACIILGSTQLLFRIRLCVLAGGMRNLLVKEVDPHLSGGKVEILEKKITLSTPDQKSNPDLTVIGSSLYYESDAQDHAAIEAANALVVLSPTAEDGEIEDWFSRQQLVMLVLFVNISLAIMFFKLLT